jgi:fluoroacetyl-CoA thioesterase
MHCRNQSTLGLAEGANRRHSLDISHEAATPSGLEVTANDELVKVEGRKLTFSVEAHDGIDIISRGSHERFVIDKEKFEAKMATKARTATPSKRES